MKNKKTQARRFRENILVAYHDNDLDEHYIDVNFNSKRNEFVIGDVSICSVALAYDFINEDMAMKMKEIFNAGAKLNREEFEEWFKGVLEADDFKITWKGGCLKKDLTSLNSKADYMIEVKGPSGYSQAFYSRAEKLDLFKFSK